MTLACDCSCKGCTSYTLGATKGLTGSLKNSSFPPLPPQPNAFSGGDTSGVDEERVSLSLSSRVEEELSKSQLTEILEAESGGAVFFKDCHCPVHNGGAKRQ